MAGERESPRVSQVGHGAVDIGVAGGGEVARDLGFLEGDAGAGGDVEAAADPLAVAAATASQAAEGFIGGDGGPDDGRTATGSDEGATAETVATIGSRAAGAAKGHIAAQGAAAERE